MEKNSPINKWPVTISTTTPVVVQQFGDEMIVEHALMLPVQRKIIHQALQEGHSCRQQSILTAELNILI